MAVTVVRRPGRRFSRREAHSPQTGILREPDPFGLFSGSRVSN